MSKDIFFKMRESEYNEIPNELKERYFNKNNVTKEIKDFDLNMQDEYYKSLYEKYKKAKKDMEERQYQLREKRRKDALQPKK